MSTELSPPIAADATARYDRERAAHNKYFGEQTRRHVDKFYSIVRESRRFYEETLRERCPGRDALEYGCGTGSHSYFLARHGAARVAAIDLSDVAVAHSRASAHERGCAHVVAHYQMNAEALGFKDESFGLICGTAILHHLDLTRAFSELARTLRPDGIAVFLEPLGHNPLISLYRRLTPGLRTVDEHPLLMRDLRLARRYFGIVQLRFFALQSLMAVPFRETAMFARVLGTFEASDRALFRLLPFTARYAWQVVLVLEDPVKS